MSYISPSGMIWLLHNIPLDKTYQNTLYWPNSEVGKRQQTEFFLNSNTIKMQFSNQYYTRHERGSVRVATLADNIFDCNYMVFQNSSFGDRKYFYAFITSVEYVNNTVAQVNFEIDVIQTWYFEFNLNPCFVEREHASVDNIGSNLVPEPVETGEYEYQLTFKELTTSALCIILAIVQVNSETQLSMGRTYGHIYGGTTLWAFLPSDISGVNAKIGEYKTSPESIVSIYMCPQCLITEEIPQSGGLELFPSNVLNGVENLSTTIPKPSDDLTFGTFTPNNKKLYTYPYTFLEVYTPEGSKGRYRYEFFDDATPHFVYGGSVTQPVTLTLAPTQYKTPTVPTSTWQEIPDWQELLTMKSYPMCSWNTDSYMAWVAQNSVPFGIAFAGALLGSVVTTSINPAVGAAAMASTTVSAITNLLTESYRASIEADKLHGTANGSANVEMEIQAFYFTKVIVNETNARLIDSFFDRYGYAVKKIQTPHRKQRKHYTYVKTVGCVINGSVPADDEERICQLHDRGITYWDSRTTTQSNIGNFGLAFDNTIQTEGDM